MRNALPWERLQIEKGQDHREQEAPTDAGSSAPFSTYQPVGVLLSPNSPTLLVFLTTHCKWNCSCSPCQSCWFGFSTTGRTSVEWWIQLPIISCYTLWSDKLQMVLQGLIYNLLYQHNANWRARFSMHENLLLKRACRLGLGLGLG